MTPTQSDTQWPRWEVFKQDGPGKVHQAVGSVHATDADHALYTARSVFARRPSAVSLRAVRDTDIHAVTLEELGAGVRLPDGVGETETYRVFAKRTHKRSMTFVDELGEVVADSPQGALERAQQTYGDGLLVWWIVPASAFVGTREDADTLESWFAPAKEKTYKQQSSYGVVGGHISKHKTPRKGGGHE